MKLTRLLAAAGEDKTDRGGKKGPFMLFSSGASLVYFLPLTYPPVLVLIEIPTRLALFGVRLDAQIVRGQKRDYRFVTPSHFELGASILELVCCQACDMLLIITSKWLSTRTGSSYGIHFLYAITVKCHTQLGTVLEYSRSTAEDSL